MADAIDQGWLTPDLGAAKWRSALTDLARAAGPPFLFSLRLWAAICLALYIAFWLQLEHAFWAGTSAAVVCQPHLGASLRKGWFRMVGTLVGAVAIVLLTAWFPQNREAFLIGLALWIGACAFVVTLLHNFAAYAAALAGFTAAVIAADELGATGGPDGLAFTFAVARVSEIWIGIVCAGTVLAGTDFGRAPRRLAARFAGLSANIASQFGATLARCNSTLEMQPVRRELVRQIIALDPAIDEAIGESSQLRLHSPLLQGAMEGLFAATAGWRAVEVRLANQPLDAARQDAQTVLNAAPERVRLALAEDRASAWTADPVGMRRLFDEALRQLLAMPAGTPSLRLLADRTARVLAGLCRVLDGLALLLADPGRPRSPRSFRFTVPDWLPAFVSAGRAVIAIGAITIFWIVTQWPSGTFAIVFAAVSVTVLVPRADQAYASALSLMAGIGVAAICAAIILFAVLPNVEGFPGFAMAMALFLIPAGFLMALQWQPLLSLGMVANFVPLLQPANEMSYDSIVFYNSALAIFAGAGAGAFAFRLLPPLSPAFRTRRLLALSLRDMRRIGTGSFRGDQEDWEHLMYGRLSVLPDAAEPVQRAQLLAALSVGAEIIRLRRVASRLGFATEFADAFDAVGHGDISAAIERFAALDRGLARIPRAAAQPLFVMRARGRILLLRDALVQHQAYFDEGGSR